MDFEFEIIDNSDEVKKAVNDAVQRALEAVGLKAEGYAKRLCAVDTGLLRNSITHAVAGESFTHDYKADREDKSGNIRTGSVSGTVGEVGESAVYIGTNVEYAPYIEMGTSRSDPQRFLQPAAEDHAEEYKRIFEHYLKNA